MRKTPPIAFAIVAVAVLTRGLAHSARVSADSSSASPILVELFTSEGCSSCPPADLLLEKMDTQPVAGAQLIVLSEHVDYWNHIGWIDPYSSRAFSERQSSYGNRLHLESVYTPEMVVDGTAEFTGSDSHLAQQALEKAEHADKVPVRLSDLRLEHGTLHAHLETGMLPAKPHKADVVVVVALNHAESQVARGENAGHHLSHVAVVRSLARVGTAEAGKAFSQDISIKLDRGADPANLRAVAFLQESGQGRVLGVTEQKLAP